MASGPGGRKKQKSESENVILSRADGEGSQASQLEILPLRFAQRQDDAARGRDFLTSVTPKVRSRPHVRTFPIATRGGSVSSARPPLTHRWRPGRRLRSAVRGGGSAPADE